MPFVIIAHLIPPRQSGRLHISPSIARFIPFIIWIIAFSVYWRTLASTITWHFDGADSGDLVTAAFTLGIPHPPGYPLYTLLASIFAHLPFGEPAHNVAAFSALTAASALVLIYYAARSLIRSHAPAWAVESIAASVALVVGFAPLFWSQAIIPETYALAAFFACALLAILLSSARYRLPCAMLVIGLALVHHLSIVLLIPSALVILMDKGWDRKQVLPSVLLLVIPLAFYLYLPVRARADPPINWGDPKDLTGLWWTLGAASYRSYLFSLASGEYLQRIATAVRLLFQQFSPWGVALGLWGAIQMLSSDHRPLRRQGIAFLLGIGLVTAFSIVYGSRNSYIYLISAFILFALWIAFGLADLAGRLSIRWAQAALVAGLIIFPTLNLALNFQTMDLSHDSEALDYARSAFRQVPNDAIIIADGDNHLFALLYYRYVIIPGDSNALVISQELLAYDWYFEQVRRWMTHLGDTSHAYLPRLEAIAEQSRRDGRKVYLTVPGDLTRLYSVLQQGDLYEILEQRR